MLQAQQGFFPIHRHFNPIIIPLGETRDNENIVLTVTQGINNQRNDPSARIPDVRFHFSGFGRLARVNNIKQILEDMLVRETVNNGINVTAHQYGDGTSVLGIIPQAHALNLQGPGGLYMALNRAISLLDLMPAPVNMDIFVNNTLITITNGLQQNLRGLFMPYTPLPQNILNH